MLGMVDRNELTAIRLLDQLDVFGSAAGLTNNGTLTVAGRDNKYLGGLLTNNGTISVSSTASFAPVTPLRN